MRILSHHAFVLSWHLWLFIVCLVIACLGLYLCRCLLWLQFLLRLQFFYHYLWHCAHIFHRWIYLFLFTTKPKLVFRCWYVVWVRGDTSISKRSVSIFLLHKLLIFLSLRSLGFRINWIPVSMVFEPEYFRAKTLVFLLVEISEEPVGCKLVLIELSHNDWILFHFAQKCVDSFVVVLK